MAHRAYQEGDERTVEERTEAKVSKKLFTSDTLPTIIETFINLSFSSHFLINALVLSKPRATPQRLLSPNLRPSRSWFRLLPKLT